MLTAGVASLRAEYLFSLAHICHIGAEESWRLRLSDFANYIDSIDAYLDAQKAAAET